MHTRNRHRITAYRIPFVLAGLLGAAVGAAGEDASHRSALAEQAATVFGVLPPPPEIDEPTARARVELGRMLYYDARLSKSHEISCNSCHDLASYGVDNEPTSPGHRGERGERNSPTVYNASLQIAQFWDGRAADVEEQAKGPVLNPVEMGMPSVDYVLRVLRSIPGYAPLFREAFPDDPDPIDFDNVATAIGAFERRLRTPGRFDRFMEGELDALSDAELAGLRTFLDTGCTACHMGPLVGGRSFQKIGVVHLLPIDDLGRYEVTGEEAHKRVFKVPQLRNVAQTHPYFHHGEVESLEEAVELMGYHQLGRELAEEDVGAIVAFLRSLTGRIDRDFVAKPELPPSGETTPAADPT